ncbi:MAG TPA: hypothetical protein VGD62_09935, partial [Acidobacteriaceae bacterium]
FLALLLALVLPWVFSLVEQEMTRRRALFRGRGLAVAALVFMGLLWTLRNAEHAHALALARTGSAETGPLTRQPILRLAAEPYPVDPFHWRILAETPDRYLTADVHTLDDRVDRDAEDVDKPPVTPAVAAAKQSRLGRVYLDWGRWPLAVDLGSMPIPGDLSQSSRAAFGRSTHTVRFTDMRFAYPGVGLGSTGSPILAGWVAVNATGAIEAEVMNGRVQR